MARHPPRGVGGGITPKLAAGSLRTDGFSWKMTTESEVQTNGAVLPGLIECLGRLATDSTVPTFNRLEAIDLLLRLAIGPRNRPANSVDVDASYNARIALSKTTNFLDRTMASSDNRARIRLHAASLARLVGRLPGFTRPQHGPVQGEERACL